MSIDSSIPSAILKAGAEVAILPTAHSPPADVLEIATICFVGSVYLLLNDGRMYATIGGKSLGSHTECYVVPATEEHRAVLNAKCCSSASSA